MALGRHPRRAARHVARLQQRRDRSPAGVTADAVLYADLPVRDLGLRVFFGCIAAQISIRHGTVVLMNNTPRYGFYSVGTVRHKVLGLNPEVSGRAARQVEIW